MGGGGPGFSGGELHFEPGGLLPDPQVRKRQVGPEVGPTSGLYGCIPTGMHGPICIIWANLTPFSLPDRGAAAWPARQLHLRRRERARRAAGARAS